MSLQININKILNSSNNIFDEIMDKVVINTLKSATKELSLEDALDLSLIDATEFSLAQLKREEGFLTQLLYKKFKIGQIKNKRRSELLILGGEIKNVIWKIERQKNRIRFYENNLSSSIENLTKLSSAFGKKLHKVEDETIKIECEIYLKEIYLQIDKANSYQKEFTVKKIYLESCLFKYNKLLRKIPRYHELQEERTNYMLTS